MANARERTVGLPIDKPGIIKYGGLFLLVVALAQRYQIDGSTIFPWALGGIVVGLVLYIQRQQRLTYFDRIMDEYRTIRRLLELPLPHLYREPDWITALYVGLQTFPAQGRSYLRPFAQSLDHISRIVYYSENALGFDAQEWSVARMHAGQALNHLLGLQFRIDHHTSVARSLYAMTAFFRTSFMDRIPGFQPEKVMPVPSHADPLAQHEWYPAMG